MLYPTVKLNSPFVVGDSLIFSTSNALYPATDGWAAQWIVGQPVPFAKAGVANGAQFDFTITAAETATLLPGRYTNCFVFTKALERYTQLSFDITLLPNPAFPLTATWAMTTLTNVEIAIQYLSTTENQMTSVNGQQFTKHNIKLLMDFRDRLRSEVAADLHLLGKPAVGGARTIHTRFVS